MNPSIPITTTAPKVLANELVQLISEPLLSDVFFIPRPCLICIECNPIAFRYHTYNFYIFIRTLFRHFIEALDECVFSITDQWIVLYVVSPDTEADSFVGVA